jgi:hypothetical protein
MAHTADDRDAAQLDLVAELGQHGREHGDRAEHGDGDHEDGPDREAGEHDAAGEEHAGHGDHHRQAGDDHRLARGRGRELERVLAGAPGVALLHLAPQVEHRVVDADRQAYEQHHRAGRLVERDELADRRHQAERDHHGRQPEEERDQGGEDRAEGHDEDDQRDREGEELGLLEVVLERLRDRLLGAGVAELADEDAGVGLLRGGGGGEGWIDPVGQRVVITRDLEGDQAGPAVVGQLALVALGERRLDLVDMRHRLEARHHVLDGGVERGIADLDRALALHEHLLVRGLGEVGGGDRAVGDLGRAVAVVLVGDRALADGAAEHEGDDDEREPAEDRRLAVLGAPAARAGRDVRGLHGLKSSGEQGEQSPESFVVRRLRGIGGDRCTPVRTASPESVRLPHGLPEAYRTRIRMMMMMSSVPSPMYIGSGVPASARLHSDRLAVGCHRVARIGPHAVDSGPAGHHVTVAVADEDPVVALVA